MVGILSYGAYLPVLRMDRKAIFDATGWFNGSLAKLAKGERTMTNWDEDVITMAVEACRDCVPEQERLRIDRLILASTTLPFADRQNSVIVKEALQLPEALQTLDVTGSQRCATLGLVAAFDTKRANGRTLLVAADRRIAAAASPAQMINGDAGAAVVLGEGDVVAELVGSKSVSVDFVDRYRPADKRHDYEWESRWIRDEGYLKIIPAVVRDVLDACGVSAEDIDHFLFEAPAPGVEKAIARVLGISAKAQVPALFDDVGYVGCAHPILQLVRTLDAAKPGQLICLVGFGQGCDVVLLRTTDSLQPDRQPGGFAKWLSRRKVETNYTKFLYFTGELAFDEGMRAELDIKTPASMLYRDRKTILGLVGGKCTLTGTVQYPKTDISVSGNARTVHTQEDYPLAERPAKVRTFTADHLAFSPDPPSCYGIVEFEGGGRMIADFTDMATDELEIGTDVRMVFRLKRADRRGFRHYFWKAVPVS